ncbi:hypothetical protein Tco_0344723 [Tanacetum coccineum]
MEKPTLSYGKWSMGIMPTHVPLKKEEQSQFSLQKITATITIAIIEESQSDWKWKEIPSTSNLSDIKQQEFRSKSLDEE